MLDCGGRGGLSSSSPSSPTSDSKSSLCGRALGYLVIVDAGNVNKVDNVDVGVAADASGRFGKTFLTFFSRSLQFCGVL